MPIHEHKGHAIQLSSWKDSGRWYANAVIPVPEGEPIIIPATAISEAGFTTQEEAERKALEVAKSRIDQALA